ncbi:MAG TPA: hypothetical protein VGG26_08175 [Terracidiphilus sp.]|jgi:hypothetical protein
MQLSTDSIWSAGALDRRRPPNPLWVQTAPEVRSKPHLRLRGLAWSVFLSALLWASFIVAGHTLWSLWR